MLSNKDAAMVYETLLSSPGMCDLVKIDLKIPRKSILLLSKLIELGLLAKEEKAEGTVLSTLDVATCTELKNVSLDLLNKAGLAEMNERLTALQTK